MGETSKRVISGIFFAAAFIFAFNYQGLYNVIFYVFVSAAVVIGLLEFYTMARRSAEERPRVKSGVTFSLILMFLIYLHTLTTREAATPGYLQGWMRHVLSIHLSLHTLMGAFIVFIFVLFLLQIVSGKLKGAIYSISVTLLGVFYVPVCAGHLIMLHALPNGIFYIWLVVFSTVMSDTTAYFCGKFFGKHKVGFAISPKKSWEGYIGGLIFQVILTVAFYMIVAANFRVPDLSTPVVIGFSVVIYVISVLGDLSESLIKRDMEVKDSGSLIPGHGGMLDVIDALILTIPGSYYFIIFMKYLKA